LQNLSKQILINFKVKIQNSPLKINSNGHVLKLSKAEIKKNKKQLSNVKVSNKKASQNSHFSRFNQEGLKTYVTNTTVNVILEEDDLIDNSKSQKSEQLPTLKKQARSKKFFDQWQHVASMSKLGNRTKNLLGKFKPSSQIADTVVVGSPPTNHSQQLLSRGDNNSLSLHA